MRNRTRLLEEDCASAVDIIPAYAHTRASSRRFLTDKVGVRPQSTNPYNNDNCGVSRRASPLRIRRWRREQRTSPRLFCCKVNAPGLVGAGNEAASALLFLKHGALEWQRTGLSRRRHGARCQSG